VVAVVVALTVPIAQLKTFTVQQACCCPDPSRCHCPDHKPTEPGENASLRACHRTQHELVSPQLPSFTLPAIAVVDAPARLAGQAQSPMFAPHAPPAAAPPYGPS
jgi:hypothetical protein